MYGDYISTSIVPGDDDATPVFAVAQQPTGATTCNVGVVCHENMDTTPEDLLQMLGGANAVGNEASASTSQQRIHATRTDF